MDAFFEPIIQANDKQNFIRPKGHPTTLKLARELYAQQCPLSVIDAETLKLIQVLRLHTTIDHTVSTTGAAVLLRSLIQPSTDLD